MRLYYWFVREMLPHSGKDWLQIGLISLGMLLANIIK